MAEESHLPVASDTSPQRLKRRTNIVNDNDEDNSNQQPFLTLSPPPPPPSPANLKAAVNGFQETHFLEEKSLTFSPKKPKLSPHSEIENPSPLAQEVVKDDDGEERENLPGSTQLLEEGKCVLVQVSHELMNLHDSRKNCSEKQSVANEVLKSNETPKKRFELELELESQKKNENLEGFLQNLIKSRFESSNGDHLTRSMKIEVIDETALIDVSMIGKKKKDKRRARKVNNSTSNSNGGRRRFVYSRREIEGLRFINVKGQKKFWQEIYYSFGETVKREYDQLGNFRHHHHHHHKPGRSYQNPGIRNDYGRGILGMAASSSRGAWNYPNLFVY